jgi:single-stranded DNA-specific DHH superfamily exonuclease
MKKEIIKFRELMKEIKNKRSAVIHDSDADGVCSAVISAVALKRISKKEPLIFHQNPGEITITEHTLSELKEKKIEFVVIVDLSVDQNPEPLKEIESFARILVLDHHKKYNEINSNKTLMIKSQDLSGEEGSKYPASKLCFDLFSELVNLNDLDWIACIGLIGDNAYMEWKDFVDGVIQKYSLEKEKDLLFKAPQLIEAIETMDYSKLKDLIFILLHAKKPKDIMKKDLLVELEEMQKEVDYWMNEFNEKKEVFPEKELIYFEIRPQHSIKSALINKISEKFPNKTIVLVQDFGEEHVYFSARRQDFKVKVNDLLEKSISGIPDSTAGGHIPAAAGKIPREYLKEFKKKLIELA